MNYEDNVLKLREQRAKVIADAKIVIDSAEGRDLTEEEQAQFDAMMGQADDMAAQADTAERKQRLQTAEDTLGKSKRAIKESAAPYVRSVRPASEDRQQMPEILRAWLTHGNSDIRVSSDTLRAADRLGINVASPKFKVELRTQSKLTDGAGNFTIPQDFGDKIVTHMKFFCPIRDHVSVIHSSDGRPMPFPVNDDTGNVASIIAEAGETTETDTVFSQKTLGSWHYRTCVRMSQELLQDSAFNLEDYLAKALGERIGRGQEPDLVNGNGSSKPTGLAYSATTAVASWTTTYANLLSLFYSVDKAYRDSGKWFMSDTIAAQIRGLLDDNLRPLLDMDHAFADGEMPSLFGKPVVISNSMDSSGSTKKVIVFGDPSDFMVRDVGSIDLVRSNERFIEFGLVAFYAGLRTDSNWFGSSRALKCGTTSA